MHMSPFHLPDGRSYTAIGGITKISAPMFKIVISLGNGRQQYTAANSQSPSISGLHIYEGCILQMDELLKRAGEVVTLLSKPGSDPGMYSPLTPLSRQFNL